MSLSWNHLHMGSHQNSTMQFRIKIYNTNQSERQPGLILRLRLLSTPHRRPPLVARARSLRLQPAPHVRS